METFIDNVKNNNYDELLKYVGKKITYMDLKDNNLTMCIGNIPDILMIDILNNTSKLYIEKSNIIKELCYYSTPEIIKYIIDKGVNLEVETNYKWRPIHFVCRYSTPEIIKYLIDKGVNLEVEDNEKKRPIHYICRYSTPEIIKYVVDKGVNLEAETIYKWRPIHYVCCYSTQKNYKISYR